MASQVSAAASKVFITASGPTGDIGGVFRVDGVKGTAKKVATGGSFVSPVGIAIEADGSVLVADADAFGGSGGVIRVKPSGGAETTVSSGGLFSNPFGVAVEHTGAILV